MKLYHMIIILRVETPQNRELLIFCANGWHGTRESIIQTTCPLLASLSNMHVKTSPHLCLQSQECLLISSPPTRPWFQACANTLSGVPTIAEFKDCLELKLFFRILLRCVDVKKSQCALSLSKYGKPKVCISGKTDSMNTLTAPGAFTKYRNAWCCSIAGAQCWSWTCITMDTKDPNESALTFRCSCRS